MGPGLYSQSSLFQKLFIPILPEFGKIASENICATHFYCDTSLFQHFIQNFFGVDFGLNISGLLR